MVDDDRSSTEPRGTSHAQQPPGGATSRGPEFGTGGEPQVPVTPHDQGENSGEGAEGVRKSFDASNAAEPGPAPTVSDEERDGMQGTESDPEPALGVGKSRTAGAEEQAPDRDMPTKGAAQRPVGKVAD